MTDDWQHIEAHSFVGMAVVAHPSERDESVDGAIAGIWEYRGEPRRLDVDHGGDRLLNIDRERVEVGG